MKLFFISLTMVSTFSYTMLEGMSKKRTKTNKNESEFKVSKKQATKHSPFVGESKDQDVHFAAMSEAIDTLQDGSNDENKNTFDYRNLCDAYHKATEEDKESDQVQGALSKQMALFKQKFVDSLFLDTLYKPGWRDFGYSSGQIEKALYFASKNGYHRVVKLILSLLTNPEIEDRFTPAIVSEAFLEAIVEGHDQVVAVFVPFILDPKTQDYFAQEVLDFSSLPKYISERSHSHKKILDIITSLTTNPKTKHLFTLSD